jgi:hypothetical protein
MNELKWSIDNVANNVQLIDECVSQFGEEIDKANPEYAQMFAPTAIKMVRIMSTATIRLSYVCADGNTLLRALKLTERVIGAFDATSYVNSHKTGLIGEIITEEFERENLSDDMSQIALSVILELMYISSNLHRLLKQSKRSGAKQCYASLMRMLNCVRPHVFEAGFDTIKSYAMMKEFKIIPKSSTDTMQQLDRILQSRSSGMMCNKIIDRLGRMYISCQTQM